MSISVEKSYGQFAITREQRLNARLWRCWSSLDPVVPSRSKAAAFTLPVYRGLTRSVVQRCPCRASSMMALFLPGSEDQAMFAGNWRFRLTVVESAYPIPSRSELRERFASPS